MCETCDWFASADFIRVAMVTCINTSSFSTFLTFEIYSLCLFFCVSTTIPAYSLVLPFNLHFIIKVLCASKTIGMDFSINS